MNRKWTHAELVDRAGRWLRNSAHTKMDPVTGGPCVTRCGVVLTDPPGGSECPDAIGWFNRGGCSILIECKATRSDFLTDKAKWIRRVCKQNGEKHGLGRFRFYMAPVGVITVDDLKQTHWGLLVVVGRTVKTHKLSGEFEHNRFVEFDLLYSGLRAAQLAEKEWAAAIVADSS